MFEACCLLFVIKTFVTFVASLFLTNSAFRSPFSSPPPRRLWLQEFQRAAVIILSTESFLRNFCHRFKPSRSCWIKYQPFKRELTERRKEAGRRQQEAAKAATPSLTASSSIEEVRKWFWGNQGSCLHLEISLGRNCGLYFLGNIVELHSLVCNFDFWLFSKTVLYYLLCNSSVKCLGRLFISFSFLLFYVCVCECVFLKKFPFSSVKASYNQLLKKASRQRR